MSNQHEYKFNVDFYINEGFEEVTANYFAEQANLFRSNLTEILTECLLGRPVCLTVYEVEQIVKDILEKYYQEVSVEIEHKALLNG